MVFKYAWSLFTVSCRCFQARLLFLQIWCTFFYDPCLIILTPEIFECLILLSLCWFSLTAPCFLRDWLFEVVHCSLSLKAICKNEGSQDNIQISSFEVCGSFEFPFTDKECRPWSEAVPVLVQPSHQRCVLGQFT